MNNFATQSSSSAGQSRRPRGSARTIGQAVRAISGADSQEPSVQLPAVRRQLLRRTAARPNEVTCSEDWLRPDSSRQGPRPARGTCRRDARRRRPAGGPSRYGAVRLGAVPPRRNSTDPGAGYLAMMVPAGAGHDDPRRSARRCIRRDSRGRYRDAGGRAELAAAAGTEGGGQGALPSRPRCPMSSNMQENSRVRVGDVNVGNVTKIERQGWHALVTMRSPATSICRRTRQPPWARPACSDPCTSSWRHRRTCRRRASYATGR